MCHKNYIKQNDPKYLLVCVEELLCPTWRRVELPGNQTWSGSQGSLERTQRDEIHDDRVQVISGRRNWRPLVYKGLSPQVIEVS
jgi:hypothetical protein